MIKKGFIFRTIEGREFMGCVIKTVLTKMKKHIRILPEVSL